MNKTEKQWMILCVHMPQSLTGSEVKVDEKGNMVITELTTHRCMRCHESWKNDEVPPDVVIGHIFEC